MSNSFELCPTHFSRGVEKKLHEVFARSGYINTPNTPMSENHHLV